MGQGPGALPRHLVEAAVASALAEDLGLAGDVTTDGIVAADATGAAAIVAREAGIVAGSQLAKAAFAALDPDVVFEALVADGGAVEAGQGIAIVRGRARAILSAERTALNFLGRLSGVATLTGRYVAAIGDLPARICCTRKTTPGLRAFEKYAVRAGGGVNHRFGLYDAALIKDNHIAAAGGVAAAVAAMRRRGGHMVMIEVEVDDLDQLDEALALGVDAILLDNMDLASLRAAVARTKGRALLEASGGVTLDSVRSIAETGVDLISSGALTHSARCLDLGLDWRS
jgi:nicotinate-nucleotide pyrophosphorylase (carboxylating)